METKTYIINNETSRLELQFSKEEYKALDGTTKSEIKSIFLFSGKAQAWVSRTKSGHYRAIAFAERLGFVNGGSIGEVLTTEEVATNKIEKQENKIIASNAVYPIIDINDISSYIIDSSISKNENDNAMFRMNPINHQERLQELLQECNNDILELITLGCSNQIEYKAKTILQSFKKKYSAQYIKVLSHKANNVSWMVSGRGGLNVSRYNKKQEQLTNMMKVLNELLADYNTKIKSFKYQIKQEKQLQHQETIKNETSKINIDNLKLIKTTKEYDPSAVENIFNNPRCEIKGYNFNEEYFIFKNWGYWRIYNKVGNELQVSTKTIKTLKEAKTHLIYIIQSANVA